MKAYKQRFVSSSGNIIRGVSMLLIVAAFLYFTSPHPYVAPVLWGLLGLSLIFVASQVWEICTSLEIDETEVRQVGLLKSRIRWSELSAVQLEFYTTRRDRETGWMRLCLVDRHGKRMNIGSSIEEFESVVGLAISMANRQGLNLSDATHVNYYALRGGRL